MKNRFLNVATFIFVIFSALPLAKSQSTAKSSEVRYSEEEIGLQDLYIKANQKKILLKYEDAIEIYKKILDKNEVNAAVHHDLARIYLALEDLENAVKSAKKAVRYDNDNRWYKMTLVHIYETAHQNSEAVEILSQVIETIQDEDLYNRLGQNLEFSDKKEEAIQIYNKADILFGLDEDRSDTKVDLYLSIGKEKEALKEVSKWSEKYPENVEYQIKLARYLNFRGEKKKAEKAFKQVLILEPENEEAIFYLTEKGKKQSNKDLSALINNPNIGMDNKILKLIPLLENGGQNILSLCASIADQYPQEAKAHALYGDALWMSNQTKKAIEQYEKSLSLNKSVYEVWDQLMLALSSDKNYDRLLEVSQNAMDYYPNQSGPYFYQALSLFIRGNVSNAIELNEEAMFIAETGKTDIFERSVMLSAQILDSQSETQQAISILESKKNSIPSSALHEYLGDLYLKIDDKIAAEKLWQEAMRLGGDKTRIQLKIQSI